MTKIILILLLLSAPSCSNMTTPRITAKQKGIDPAFNHYIERYIEVVGSKYKKNLKYLNMNFVDLEDGVIGKCHWLINGQVEVEIDIPFWNDLNTSYIDRLFTTHHELEHCLRYRMHTNNKEEIENIVDFFHIIGFYLGIIPEKGYLPDGCPASLMHSHLMSDICQQKHYNYYIKEMRDWKK